MLKRDPIKELLTRILENSDRIEVVFRGTDLKKHVKDVETKLSEFHRLERLTLE